MTIAKLTETDVRGKRVFIRADLNVPQDDAGNITEDTRIRASLPSIRYCLENGARAIMVTSHLGRPTEGTVRAEDTLTPVAVRLGQLLEHPVRLVPDWVDGGFEAHEGEVLLLENCRCNVGEKKDDEALARKMAALCDVYVNDAFGTAHRAEATTHAMARFAPVACAGVLMGAEIDALTRATSSPARWLPSSAAPRCPASSPSCARWPKRSTNSSSAAASPTHSCLLLASASGNRWRKLIWSRKRKPSST